MLFKKIPFAVHIASNGVGMGMNQQKMCPSQPPTFDFLVGKWGKKSAPLNSWGIHGFLTPKSDHALEKVNTHPARSFARKSCENI
jgi:hypothetical protein